MTWEQWVESEYNSDNYYIVANQIWVSSVSAYVESATPSSVIENGYTYSTRYSTPV